MSRKQEQDAKLLAETFQGDWSAGPPAEFARAGAAHARKRRRVRQALLAAGGSAAVALAVAVLHFSPGESSSITALSRHDAKPTAVVAAATNVIPAKPTTPGYEIISDEELIAQLRDRPLLVVKKDNGTREIVVWPNE